MSRGELQARVRVPLQESRDGFAGAAVRRRSRRSREQA